MGAGAWARRPIRPSTAPDGKSRTTHAEIVGLADDDDRPNAIDSSPRYATAFNTDGAPVAAKAGNRIVSSAMDPAGRTVLPDDFQATAGDGDGTVTGTCHPNSLVGIGRGPYAEWTLHTPSGAISRTDLSVASGETMIIACQSPDGYGQRFLITVP